MTFSTLFVTLLNIMSEISNPQTVKTLPVVPIRDGVVFPNTEIVLTFGRPRSLSAIEASNTSDRLVVLVMQKSAHLHDPQTNDLYTIGTIARIERLLKTENEINALVKGIARVEILSYEAVDPYFQAKVVEAPDEIKLTDETTALSASQIRQLLKEQGATDACRGRLFLGVSLRALFL